MERAGKLLSIKELRDVVGPNKLSRPMAYFIARKYGFRLGRRFVVPHHIVEDLLKGRLDLKKEGTNDKYTG